MYEYRIHAHIHLFSENNICKQIVNAELQINMNALQGFIKYICVKARKRYDAVSKNLSAFTVT